jgi:RNA polymerase sigma factor (sigma-70 family)
MNQSREALEHALLEIANGNRAALQQLYALSSAKLFGVCLRISKDRQISEDLLQETYLKIWRRAATYQPGLASPISWLVTIARNTALDWRRAQPAAFMESDDQLAEIVDATPDAITQIDGKQKAQALYACLGELDGRYSPAIRAAYLDGFSYSELATKLDKPLGTIKSWIRRGLAQLSLCLKQRKVSAV